MGKGRGSYAYMCNWIREGKKNMWSITGRMLKKSNHSLLLERCVGAYKHMLQGKGESTERAARSILLTLGTQNPLYIDRFKAYNKTRTCMSSGSRLLLHPLIRWGKLMLLRSKSMQKWPYSAVNPASAQPRVRYAKPASHCNVFPFKTSNYNIKLTGQSPGWC